MWLFSVVPKSQTYRSTAILKLTLAAVDVARATAVFLRDACVSFLHICRAQWFAMFQWQWCLSVEFYKVRDNGAASHICAHRASRVIEYGNKPNRWFDSIFPFFFFFSKSSGNKLCLHYINWLYSLMEDLCQQFYGSSGPLSNHYFCAFQLSWY